MRMNTNIPMGAQVADPVNALAAGMQTYQAGQAQQRQNELSAYLAGNADGLARGEEQAVAGLYEYDPGLASDLQSDRNRRIVENRNIASQEALRGQQMAEIAQRSRIAASDHARELDAAALEREQADLERIAFGMSAARRQGPETLAAFIAENEEDIGGLDQFGGDPDVAIAAITGSLDGFDDAVKDTAAIQEYKFAQDQGFDGSFEDWKNVGKSSLSVRTADGTVIEQGPTRGASTDLKESQSKNVTYYTRALGASENLDKYEDAMTGASGLQGAIADWVLPQTLSGYLKSDEYKLAEQAGREWLAPILRKDTGAAVTDTEFQIYGAMYLPIASDGPELVAQKRMARARAMDAVENGMSPDEIQAAELRYNQERAAGIVGEDRPTFTPPEKVEAVIDPDTPVEEAVEEVVEEDQQLPVVNTSTPEPPRRAMALGGIAPIAAEPTPEGPGALGGTSAAVVDGLTFGGGDETLAGLSAILGVQPDGQGGANWFDYSLPMGERYDVALGAIREEQGQFQDNHPILSAVAEVAGAVAGPGKLVKGAQTVKGMMATGAAGGGLYGFLEGENGIPNRLKSSIVPAATGFVLAPAVGVGANALFRRNPTAWAKRYVPTTEQLSETTRKLYRTVDRSGAKFDQADMASLSDRFNQHLARSLTYDPIEDTAAGAVQRRLAQQANKETTITQLDKMRRGFWDRYNATVKKGQDGTDILDAIKMVDDVIDQKAATSEAIAAARNASKIENKAKLFDSVIRNAELETAATGSGGNVVNKYKQAVNKILKNKSQLRFFNESEIDMMEQFVKGDTSSNSMRLLGKLSPSGNGLMMALNVGAIAANPMMAVGTVAGSMAKSATERGARRGISDIGEEIATGGARVPRPVRTIDGRVPLGAGVAGENANEVFR